MDENARSKFVSLESTERNRVKADNHFGKAKW